MGSFNGTCMISNLHVTAGQDVVVFMLAKNSNPYNSCYENSFYSPCPIPFYGKYNDYGAVEECYGFGLDLVVDAIRNQLYEFYQGPNSSHDCEVLKTNFDLEKLFEADHEGRLGIQKGYKWSDDDYDIRELKRQHNEKGLTESQLRELDRLSNKLKKDDAFREVTHVIIHGDIFKAITEKFFLEEYVGDGGNYGHDNRYIRTTFQDIINDIPGYIEKVKVDEVNADGCNSYEHLDRVARRLPHMIDSSSGRNYSIISPHEYIEEYIKAKNWKGLAAFVKELMTTYWISTFMSSTRKHWIKMTGAGSQSNESLGYTILSNSTLDILTAEKEKWQDYDNEENEVSNDISVQKVE